MKIAASIFKTLFLCLCIIANTHLAYAQTASILPQGKTQFLDNNGKPLTSGTVDFYIPSTTTRKTTWQNSAETIANANPVVLDAGGRAIIYGDGSYRQVVKDRLGNIIWDQLTSSTGSGGGSTPTATGDGDLVGTIKPWAGMTAPNQYAFTYGQEVSRTTYAALYTAITSSQATFCTSGSPTLTGLTDTTNFWIGASLEVSCVAAGFSTVVSKTSTTVTMAANANVTTNTTVIFYSWGRGNGSTTFNLPDLRGFAIAGNNNMGGVANTVLTTTYFGSTNPNSSGAAGGTESFQLVAANLPPYTPSGTITNGAITTVPVTNTVAGTGVFNAAAGGSTVVAGGSVMTLSSTQATSTFAGTPTSGVSMAIGRVQPTKTANYIIKITPDANSATASGVTSLGSMTGDIACGSGLLCTGNNISVVSGSSALIVGTTAVTSGISGRVLYDNAGILGEYTTIPVANGGTNLASGTSGGILGYTGATTLASSGLLPFGQVLVGGGSGATPSGMGSNGTTTTVLHGNAAGAPTYGAIVSADMNITATNCTNQFVSAISTGGVGTCTTATLASAQFANQGTSTTVLHGNAAGNPTFGAVSLTADVSGTLPVANGGIGATSITSALDTAFSSTQGAILYRNATVWTALTPGTAGQFLTTQGAAANPNWSSGGAGTGTVTSVTPGTGLVSGITTSCDQTAITASGTLYSSECINAQTGTSYAIVNGDRAKLVTASNAAAQAYTLAQAGAASAFQNGWYVDVKNNSTNAAGIVTITPTTSTIDGAATLVLRPGRGARISSDGTNYQVSLTGGKQTLPTTQVFTSGSGTYTTPANVQWIEVDLVGGGGGGAGAGSAPGNGGNGGDTTFSTLTGSGGVGAVGSAGGAGGASSGGFTNKIGGAGGNGSGSNTTNGGAGGISFYGSAGNSGVAGGGSGVAAGVNSGSGGGGGGVYTTPNGGGGGGSGGYVKAIINSPAASYSYGIGAAGTAGTAGGGSGGAGGAGGSGYIQVIEHYNN